MAHVYQLGSAQRAWVSEPREWCKDVHRKRDRDGRPIRCTQCTTCHWCRWAWLMGREGCGVSLHSPCAAAGRAPCSACTHHAVGRGSAAPSRCSKPCHRIPPFNMCLQAEIAQCEDAVQRLPWQQGQRVWRAHGGRHLRQLPLDALRCVVGRGCAADDGMPLPGGTGGAADPGGIGT